MKKVVIQFNNLQVKTFKCKSYWDLNRLLCGHVSYCWLLRYKELEPCQSLMKNDAYIKEYAKFSLLQFFGASVLNCEKIDGRTNEAKNLPWFSADELLTNFQ